MQNAFMCNMARFGDLPMLVSGLVEVHIAVACTLTLRRCTSAESALNRCLIWAWPLGCATGALELYVLDQYWDVHKEHCHGARSMLRSIMFVSCAAICCFLYCGNAWLSRDSSGGSSTRAVKRTLIFVVVNVLTQVPISLRIFLHNSNLSWAHQLDHAVTPSTVPMLCLGGFFNALVYAVLNRSTARSVSRRQQQEPQIILNRREDRSSMSWEVDFAKTDDITEVPNIAQEAKQRALSQTQTLHWQREQDAARSDEEDFLAAFDIRRAKGWQVQSFPEATPQPSANPNNEAYKHQGAV